MAIARKRRFLRILFFALIFLLGALTLTVGRLARFLYWEKIDTAEPQTHLYVPTGTDLPALMKILDSMELVSDTGLFRWAARIYKFEKVHPGHYLVPSGWTHYRLLDLLRKGIQKPVTVTIRNVAYKEQLAGLVGRQIEADSLDVLALLEDSSYLARWGFTPTNILAMFQENSYEFYWTTDAMDFMERMAHEHQKFWTAERLSRARQLGLSTIEVVILASIVQKEAIHADEMPRIAGVYLNRLRRGMPLQADPTIQYVLRRWKRRLLHRHTRIPSPFNTYLHTGLPPGPIAVPSPRAIEAVLRAERHNYLYFCARADFSGYHAFARTYAGHLRNARRYRRALDERGIR